MTHLHGKGEHELVETRTRPLRIWPTSGDDWECSECILLLEADTYRYKSRYILNCAAEGAEDTSALLPYRT